MKYLGNLTEDQVIDFKFSTHTASGTPITLAGTPVVKVYKGNATDTEVTTGVTLSVDFDGVTGLHNVNIDTSAAAFYAVGSDYSVVITTGTVDSVSVVGTVLATFSIENRYIEADVVKWLGTGLHAATVNGVPVVQLHDSAGAGGINAPANFEDLAIVDTAGTVTYGNAAPPTAVAIATGVWQDATAGDFTAANSIGKSLAPATLGTIPGAAGGISIVGSAMTLANGSIVTATFGTCVPPAPTGMSTLTQTQVTGGAYDITNATPIAAIAAGLWRDAVLADFQVASSIGKALYTGNFVPGAAGGLFIAGSNAATTFATLTVTGALTAGSNAVPWNASWDTEVQSEVDDALVAQRLDELLNADSDIDGAAPPTVGSVFHELMTKTAGSFTYDQTSDSLEAIRDRGDSAWITATGFSTLTTGDIDARLAAIGLDHLVAVATGIPAVTAGTYLDQIMDDGTAVYDRITDSLQAVRDTAPLGTAMRGTDSAALASVCTEGRLAELDAANLPTDVAAIPTTKTGYSLAAAGLDAIPITPPSGAIGTWTFRERLMMTFRRLFGKSTMTATQLKTFAENGTTVLSTQTLSDDATTQTEGEAS